jgi:hypothetical protein
MEQQLNEADAWRQFITRTWFSALWWIFFTYQVLHNIATGHPVWAFVWLFSLAGLFTWGEKQEAALRQVIPTGQPEQEPVSL